MTTVLFGSRGSDRETRQPVGYIVALVLITYRTLELVLAGKIWISVASDDSGHFA